MRLVWSTTPGIGGERCYCGGISVDGSCAVCKVRTSRYRSTKRVETPLIGPRQRLPQAKDVPEAAILAALSRRPGKWHGHWRTWPDCRCDLAKGMPTLGCAVCFPELMAFPEKVVWAKLCSMSRRGLVQGGGNYDSRCDWHVEDRSVG